MLKSLDEIKQTSHENTKRKITAGVLTAALVFLTLSLVLETTRYPASFILVLISLCLYFIYDNVSKIQRANFEINEPRFDRYENTPDFRNNNDPRFSEDTHMKVMSALNKGMIFSNQKLGTPFQDRNSSGNNEANRLSTIYGNTILRDVFSNNKDQTSGFKNQTQESWRNVVNPNESSNYRKVYLDSLPNTWGSEIKQEERANLQRFDHNFSKSPNTRMATSNNYYVSAKKYGMSSDGNFPLVSSHPDNRNSLMSRRSINNPMLSKNKRSVGSKGDGAYEEIELDKSAHEFEVQLRVLIVKHKIDYSEYMLWAQHNTPAWISNILIPELIYRNLVNVKNINQHLNAFSLELIEYHCLIGFEEGDWKSEKYEFDRRGSEKKWISIDEFLRFAGMNFSEFRQLDNQENEKTLNFKEAVVSMRKLAVERELLDRYFGENEKEINRERLAKLRRLYQIKEDNFASVFEENGEEWTDADLLLGFGVQCVRENDPYYRQGWSGRSSFIGSFLRNMDVKKDDFYIEKSDGCLLLLLSGERNWFKFDVEGVCKILTFLVHFIQGHHFSTVKLVEGNALSNVVKNLDVRKVGIK